MGKKRYQECMNLVLARAEFGNTQVTRHVGVPSWVFTPLLTYTYYHYFNPHTFPRLGPFFPFPTHPLLYYHLISFLTWHPPETNLVEEDRWNGVHPPTPSTFAPWSS